VRSLIFGSKISDYYVQPNIGGDSAFLLGIIKCLVELNALDTKFIEQHVEGLEDVIEQASSTDWTLIEEASGVKQQTIAEVASVYANSKGTIFCWAMGITHTMGGVDAVRMIANVAMSRGMLGRKGAGLLPLRGHSNVQGIGSMGVVPVLKPEMKAALESALQITLPKTKEGFRGDTMACMEAADRGEIDFTFCLGGNLLGANPDTTFAMHAMSNIPCVGYLSTTLNQGHFLGRGKETIILPVLPRDEEPHITTQESMFNYVRRSEGGTPRHEGPRSEIDIIIELASNAVGKIDWEKYRDADEIRQLIATCIKGFDPYSEHQIQGRTFHEPHFPTPSGKAIAHKVEIAIPRSRNEEEFRLMTLRSEGQFNTVVYEEEDIYRGQSRRDIVMMHQDDMKRIGVATDELVRVTGHSGSLHVIARPVNIAMGNCAMYYPEANVLLSHRVSEESRTPFFKGEIIKITSCVDA
jgi:molybdopterin-dependent oxidoreductase alpha subunit